MIEVWSVRWLGNLGGVSRGDGAGEGAPQRGLTTIEHWGRGEKEQPKVGPKGEGEESSESKCTEDTECMRCNAWTGQASVAFSNSFPIKLARNSENTSLIRYAAYPAFRPLCALSAN